MASKLLGLSEEFFVNVALGNVSGYSYVNKFGRNEEIASGETEDVWAGGGSRTYLSAAETMDIVSGSSDDDGSPAGTGAQTLYIEGLDSNYEVISETVTSNGLTEVVTVNSYLRVHRAYVMNVGAGGVNAGIITIDPTTTGSGARQGIIAAGDGQTAISHYTIPAGKTGYLVGGQLTVGSTDASGGAKEALFRLWRRNPGESWRLQKEVSLRSAATSVTPDIDYKIPVYYEEKTDLKWTATADANNTSVTAQFCIMLVDD